MDRFRTTSGDAFRDPSSYKNSKKNNVSGNSSCASTLLKGQEEEPNSDELLGSAETIDRTNYDRRSAKGLEKRKTNEAVLDLEDQIRATIYGHCIGDAIGLLTEFMSQDQAHAVEYLITIFFYKQNSPGKHIYYLNQYMDIYKYFPS